MSEAESLLLRIYGSSPQMRILDYLMMFPKNDFTHKDILEELGMSKTTFYKYFINLVEFGLVRGSRKIAKSQLYTINLANPIVESIKRTVEQASDDIANRQLEKSKLNVTLIENEQSPTNMELQQKLEQIKKDLGNIQQRMVMRKKLRGITRVPLTKHLNKKLTAD
jgi:predicted transcriptional regulator